MPRLLLNPSVVASLTGGVCITYNVRSNQLHRLNPTAALLMELCDGERTREMVLAAMLPLVGDGGIDGCAAWLAQGIADGLILEGDAPTGSDMTAPDLARWAHELRDTDRVLAAFICQQRAAELAPDVPEHWHALGELAHIVGRRDEARKAYERYHEACPEDLEAGHLLTALRDEPPPPRASNAYIEQLYATFAGFYESNVCGDLDYRAPQLLLDAVSASLQKQSDLSVLGLGCGTGLFGRLIRPRARRLVGVDLSKEMVERARDRRIYDVLEIAEITAWLAPEPRARHDLIAICDTLIYFGDLRQVIPQAARHLTREGVLAFTVEKGDAYPFRLTDSGRFAHHQDHLKQIAADLCMRILSLAAGTLRYEYGQPVTGWIAVLGQASE